MAHFYKNNKNIQGDWAEITAQRYLTTQGLTPIAKNFNTRIGEIDLIFKSQDTLVFVEVRQRIDPNFMHPFESISPNKQHKLQRTAECFVQHHPEYKRYNMRFDAIAILGPAPDPDIEWLPNAF